MRGIWWTTAPRPTSFDECMALAKAEADGSKFAKPLANLIINDVAAWLNAHEGTLLADTPLTAAPGAFACEDACG